MVYKRIYLISPCRNEDIWRKRRATFVLPQMSLAILAALTPERFEVKVTDELVDDIDFSYPADLVAISTNSTNAPRAYEVAKKFREKGSRIIMGGIHPSVMPDEVLRQADALLVGEAEEMWQIILDDFLSGSLLPIYRAAGYPAAESIPSGKWEMIHQKRYYVPRTFQTSRGCPYGCSFCSSTQFFGTKQRCRPIGNIISELKGYNGRLAVFIDDNIAGNSTYAKELFRALKPLKQRWVAQSSIDIARDNELLRLAAESGCAGLLIGFESVNANNSADMKKLRKAEQYAEHVSEIRSAGIGVHGSFIFGFDHDTPDIFDSTVDFVMNNRLEVANYCKLTPFPGTKLFEEMSKQGRILHHNWEKYDRYHIVYKPKNIPAEELHQKTLEAYLKTYSLGSILKRMPAKIQNILPYFAMNISYRLGSKRLRRS
ncbi:MAG: B12-binding domain-containing radical SAM protein [Nitrospirae bacterium]|nr:B12-binding domain-containing radical SAM protein [Nitrospirota bacterium]